MEIGDLPNKEFRVMILKMNKETAILTPQDFHRLKMIHTNPKCKLFGIKMFRTKKDPKEHLQRGKETLT